MPTNRSPVVLITGVDPDASALAGVGLLWDLPGAIAVRHRVDVESSLLQRVVSDASGIREQVNIHLEHACISCALREDVVPTLRRLAVEGGGAPLVAQLPVGASPEQVCAVLADPPRPDPVVWVAAVVAAVDGATIESDVLGNDLLCERGLHSSDDDRRGVGEVLAAMIEYADATIFTEVATATGFALGRTLARPDAEVLRDPSELDAGSVIAGGWHDRDRISAWVEPDRRTSSPAASPGAWRLDLRSDRPFDPERLVHDIAGLGGGPTRSRGCFWVPTRPGAMGIWSGAGGQLSVGSGGPWFSGPPHTRIEVVGTGEAPDLRAAFDRLLVTASEQRRRGSVWEVTADGLEPWLGPVRRIA
jgi:G3E family GTPase